MSWKAVRRLSVGVPILVVLLIFAAPQVAAFLFTVVAVLAPLWLPLLLAALLAPLWLRYVRSRYVSRVSYVTLELKPGDNTPKTARPMELIFYSLYYRTDISLTNALWKGVVRVPWSFEICASGGTVRFFMHVPVQHRAAIEGRIRTEYRDVDIDEVRDYTRERAISAFESHVVMREYALTKPDPYPLRTYVTHEHEKVRRDVFGELLEELATVGEHEELWVSLMLRPHQRDWPPGLRGFLEVPKDTLHEDAQREIRTLLGSTGDIRRLPETQQSVVHAIEEALKKPSFDCGLRVLYRAERNHFNDTRAQSLEALFDRFKDPVLNSYTSYDPSELLSWPLPEIFAILPAFRNEYLVKLFRRRAFFAPPYYGKQFVLNTEELATLFHLPKVGRASALSRSRGVTLQPPENLPV